MTDYTFFERTLQRASNALLIVVLAYTPFAVAHEISKTSDKNYPLRHGTLRQEQVESHRAPANLSTKTI